jgi:hypothetical protein
MPPKAPVAHDRRHPDNNLTLWHSDGDKLDSAPQEAEQRDKMDGSYKRRRESVRWSDRGGEGGSLQQLPEVQSLKGSGVSGLIVQKLPSLSIVFSEQEVSCKTIVWG